MDITRTSIAVPVGWQVEQLPHKSKNLAKLRTFPGSDKELYGKNRVVNIPVRRKI